MAQQASNFGLTFTADHIQAAQNQRDADVISDAFRFLDNIQQSNPIASAYLLGLRYCFMNDTNSGEHAFNQLESIDFELAESYLQAVQDAFACLQVIAMLGDHPSLNNLQTPWIQSLRRRIGELSQAPDYGDALDELWYGAMNVGAGIVFEDDTAFNTGEAVYKKAIMEIIHPEGYLKRIVDDEDGVTDTYAKQVSGSSALVIMAEMAKHVGVDLWSFDNRGITPITATTYILYYYYYPEKWKWEAELTEEQVEAVIKSDGAFMEIANRHSAMRAIEPMLDFQRPLFCYYAGGLTTLTHGTKPTKKKKGWRLFG